MNNRKTNKTVSLILGSGGARGLAHIGVIRELEAAGYSISAISGCSIGAVVGGIYAADKLDAYESWACQVRRVDVIKLMDLSWEKSGLLKGDKVIATLTELVGDQLIEDLPIRFTAVATNLENNTEVWLNKGSLFDAIRASISIPWLLTPVKYKGAYLVDGGILNPVPMAPSFNDHTDYKIAVNLGGPDSPQKTVKRKKTKIDESSFRGRIDKFIEQMSKSFTKGDENTLASYELGNLAFEAMQSTIARHKLAAYPPDYLIEIPSNAANLMDFHKAEELIALGREHGKKCIERIEEKENGENS